MSKRWSVVWKFIQSKNYPELVVSGCASFAPVFWGFCATRVLGKMATSDGLALTLRHFGFTSSDLPDGSMVRSPLRKGPVGAAFGWRWRPEPSCLCRSTHQVLFPSAEREGVGCDKNRTFILQKVSLTNYHIESLEMNLITHLSFQKIVPSLISAIGCICFVRNHWTAAVVDATGLTCAWIKTRWL